MTHVACRLTAKNRDRLRNNTLGNRVWATFIYLFSYSWGLGFTMRVFPGSISWMVVFWGGGEVVRGMNECLHSPRLGPVCPRAGLHGASDQQLDSVSSQLVIQLRGPGRAGGPATPAHPVDGGPPTPSNQPSSRRQFTRPQLRRPRRGVHPPSSRPSAAVEFETIPPATAPRLLTRSPLQCDCRFDAAPFTFCFTALVLL